MASKGSIVSGIFVGLQLLLALVMCCIPSLDSKVAVEFMVFGLSPSQVFLRPSVKDGVRAL
jgi:hypothetical protein